MKKANNKRHIRTSNSDPLNVAWLPTPYPGRVGLTLAPGKHQTSQEGAPWARDLAPDLDRLVQVHEAHVLVCLLEDAELGRLKIPNLVAEAEARGLEVHRLPIRDGGVLPKLAPMRALVQVIAQAAQAGRNVVVHCAGGLGRAGTVGGCLLTHTGQSPDEALKTLAERRSKRCPENNRQKDFIREFARTAPPEAARGTQDDLRDKVAGVVLAGAIGDAMGNPTEFMSMASIRATYGPQGVQGFEKYWTRDGLRFAPYTDDTQMAEVVARSLITHRQQQLDLDATMQHMAEGFVRWSTHPQGGHRGPGNACLAGCRALAQGVAWSKAGGPKAGGCGSVMRAYPFGVVFRDDLERAESWAVAHSRLTHQDPIALAASAAMALGIAHLLRGESLAFTLGAMIEAAGRYSETTAQMMRRAVQEAEEGVGPEVTLDRLEGWAAHEAIAAAVYVLARHPDDPRKAILEAANTPGDSDSLATLAGALLGARVGRSALPQDWVADVERSAELLALADELLL